MSKNSLTRGAILAAFNELIVSTDFSLITVQEICTRADVSKATFYRYFSDKYDVMNENYRSMLLRLGAMPEVHGYRDLYEQLYLAARKDIWKAIRRSFSTEGYNSFKNFIAQYSYAYSEAITRQNRGGKGFTETEKLQSQVYVYGIAQMYENWTFGKYKLTAAEAADALFALMPEALRDYWWIYPVKEEDIKM